uniref:serine O-acetyltransferase n=1 Tax=Chloropicon primus TaxID=1764295 RepID=A0A7S2T0P8_9CHLO
MRRMRIRMRMRMRLKGVGGWATGSARRVSTRVSPRQVVRPSGACGRLRAKREDEGEAWEEYQWRKEERRSQNGNGATGARGENAAGRRPGALSTEDEGTWREQGFAFYQNRRSSAEDEFAAWDWGHVNKEDADFNPVWTCIRKEAEEESSAEPLLSSRMYSSVLSHQSFEMALANILANGIGDKNLLPCQLIHIFLSSLQKDKIRTAALLDLQVTKDRDPACKSYLEALVNFKGYHALQLHRISHDCYSAGRVVMAQMLQSRSSEVYGVDIHPGAKFGKGILIDHGTGVVVGETAVIGDNSSLLQGVTLGGTGKASGDRHPKLGNNVLIGAQATVLGNISIGEGSMIAAGSVVLKDVPANTLIAGIPAKVVGSTKGNPATLMDQLL